jgi:hypothetical protein
MKRYLLCLALLQSAFLLFGQTNLYLNLGLNIPGSHSVVDNEYARSYATNTGFAPSAEILFSNFSPALKLGLGAEYEVPRKVLNTIYDVTYSFQTTYVAARFNIPSDVPTRLEALAHLGINSLQEKVDLPGTAPYSKVNNGLYWALGLGYELPSNWCMQALYQKHQGHINKGVIIYGELDISKSQPDLISQTNITLQIGHRFSIK